MNTRTKNALAMGAALAVLTAGLVWVAAQRAELPSTSSALSAVPAGALLVARADMRTLRHTSLAKVLLGEGREIPGLGKVRDVCGMDPLDSMDEVVLAIPAAGEPGDFGIAAFGAVADEALVACASKVIEARGGKPVVTPIGGFRCVRDARLSATGGEIAVRKGGPVLLGAGTYLRAMIDAVEGRGPTLRSSVAHTRLAEELGPSDLRITVVLTPEQRRTLDEELDGDMNGAASPLEPKTRTKGMGGSLVAGAVGLSLSTRVLVRGLLICESQGACEDWAVMLRKAKTKRSEGFAMRLMGVGDMLTRVEIEAQGESVRAKVDMETAEAERLLERLLMLRERSRPMPDEKPGPEVLPEPADARIPALPTPSDGGIHTKKDAGSGRLR